MGDGRTGRRRGGPRCIEVQMHDDRTISYVGERDWAEIRGAAQSIRKVEGSYVLRFGAIYEVTTTRHYLVVPPRPGIGRGDPVGPAGSDE